MTAFSSKASLKQFITPSGVSKTQGGRKGKSIAALDHFEKIKTQDIPAALTNVIDAAYGEAATAKPADPEPRRGG